MLLESRPYFTNQEGRVKRNRGAARVFFFAERAPPGLTVRGVTVSPGSRYVKARLGGRVEPRNAGNTPARVGATLPAPQAPRLASTP
jgi:hypothetical protein